MANFINIPPDENFTILGQEDTIIKASDVLIGDDTFEAQAAQAQQLSELNTLMAQSRSELIDASTARVQQPVDEQGRPTFSTLVQDIDTIGQGILDKNSENITDPIVARQFELQFGSEIKSAQIKARGLARNQQLQFMRQSFAQEHDSLVKAAGVDPFTPPTSYIKEYNQKLDAAVVMGLYTPEERDQLAETFRSSASQASFAALVKQDVDTANQLLNTTPELTAMTKDELDNARKLVNSALKDREVATKQQAALHESQRQAQSQLIVSDLSSKINEGTAGDADIEQVKGVISDQDVRTLKKELTVNRKKLLVADRDHLRLVTVLKGGGDLSQFKPAQIQNSYNRVLNQIRSQFGIGEGEPIPLSLKATVGRVFRGPVKSLAKDIEMALESDNLQDAVEAINAYKILSKENPIAIDTLTEQSEAIAAMALTLIDKTDTPDQAAILRARQAVLEADDPVRQERGANYRKQGSFKGSNIGETAREALGGDPLFGFNRRLASGVAAEFDDLAREAYVRTGDADAAIKSATHQMSKLYGETSFNGGRFIMFAPPEKMVPNVAPETLQNVFSTELKSMFPNIKIDKVEIVSDDLTRLQQGKVSYALQFRDEAGSPVPLVNPNTGQLIRWVLDPRNIQAVEARRIRTEAAAQRELFPGVDAETTITRGQIGKQQLAKEFEQASDINKSLFR
jgi:hypothetical protein